MICFPRKAAHSLPPHKLERVSIPYFFLAPSATTGDAAVNVAWLQTNGVNTRGAAAKVTSIDRLGKKVRPGTFGKIKVG